MSVYSLEDDERKSVEDIFNNLPKLRVVDSYKSALNEMTDKACDELMNYLQDEYVLRLEEVVEKQARKVVEALLRGEDLAAFGLQLQTSCVRPNEVFVWDGEKVRAAIVRDFAAEIQTAEMHELRTENERLKEQLEWYRRDR